MVRRRSAAAVDPALLDGVLAVVRRLGGCADLGAALSVITDAMADVLGFGAAAINVTTLEGDLRVEAVVGPSGVNELLGTCVPVARWLEWLDSAEEWGELRFFDHERDQAAMDHFPSWRPSGGAGPEPDAWHPDDSLFAPLWDEKRNLVGVLSVDMPRSGRRPDQAQCTVLEVIAGQAAKAIRDAQARAAADEARREIESRWRLAFERSPTGSALVSAEGQIVQVNEAFASMLGYSAEQLARFTFAEITHPDDVDTNLVLFAEMIAGSRDRYEIEKRYVRRDGEIVHAVLHVGAIRDERERVQTIIAQTTDITERKEAERRLAHNRTHDPLTGLPNRTAMADRVARRLLLGETTAALLCDIDRFKSFNAGLGRAAGDQLLVEVAQLIESALPVEAELGRVGDDEFLVLAPGGSGPSEVTALGERLIAALRRAPSIGRILHRVSISIGAAITDGRHEHADELMADAEAALRRAKRRGRARLELHDPAEDPPSAAYDVQLGQDFHGAVGSGRELVLHLQPIVSVEGGAVVGAEALVRWNHPTRGLLVPADFLPIAEDTGLIVDLGWHMLHLGVQAAAEFRRRGENTWVAVNVSATQLGRGELAARVRKELVERDLPATSLHLEITETALVEASQQAIRELREVAGLGVSIALDDFGTGYSSLSLLRDLPISVVKIDRSFTGPIAEDRRTAALVRSVVNMCNALEIKTIAEGVETSEQLALVSALGCDHAQGYLFGRPEVFPRTARGHLRSAG